MALSGAVLRFVLQPTLRHVFRQQFPSLDPYSSEHGASMLPSMELIQNYDDLRDWDEPVETLEELIAHCDEVEHHRDYVLLCMAHSGAEERLGNQSTWLDDLTPDYEPPTRRSARIEARHQAWWVDLYHKWHDYAEALNMAIETMQADGPDGVLAWLVDAYPQPFWTAVWEALFFQRDQPIWREADQLLERLCALIQTHTDACREALTPLLIRLHERQQEERLHHDDVAAALHTARITLAPPRFRFGQGDVPSRPFVVRPDTYSQKRRREHI